MKILLVLSTLLVIVPVYMMVDYERRLAKQEGVIVYASIVIQDLQKQNYDLTKRNHQLAEWVFGELLPKPTANY